MRRLRPAEYRAGTERASHKLRLVALLAVGAAIACGPAAPAAGGAPAASKLDWQLRWLASGRQVQPKPGHRGIAPGGLTVSRSGEVLVDVYVDGPVRSAAAALRDRGMRVIATSGRSPQRMVEGWLPVDRLAAVAALRRTGAVMPVMGSTTNATTSQGDAVHRGPQVRALGHTGAGVPVGIMSNSIDQASGGVAGSQASGDLPATVQVLNEVTGGNDEGRAMAEIVFDTAPGIPKIVFARGVGGGAAERAANIDALVANGAKVIADDTVLFVEPMFQDGVIAQAADRAKASGTAYLVSAGNRARQAWEGVFTPAGAGGAENDFDPGGGEDLRQSVVTIPAGASIFFVVNWDEPWGGATTDLALDVYALPNQTTPAFTANTDNVATGLPIESTAISNSGGSPVTVAIGLRRVAGSRDPRLRWLAHNSGFGTFTPLEHNTGSHAIDPDAASARGALAVAAVRHDEPGLDDAEAFSSRGPLVTRYFDVAGNRLAQPDVRSKPDIAGADGVATSVSGFNPFFGTSAAAPSAAGVAALLLSAKPSLSVDALYAILRDPANAVDCSAPGFPDGDCGAGFIRADGKLAQALDSTPPSVVPALTPAAASGANGWYVGDVGLAWGVSDGESPIATRSGCDPQAVTSDGVFRLTCTASSAGGQTGVAVTVMRDASPPAAPVFSGIGARRYSQASLPPPAAIGCSSSDPTSGVGQCAVTGFAGSPGAHRLTATAVNQAGLSSTATLDYSVTRSFAARGLRLPRRVSLRSLLRSGMRLTVVASVDATALDATLRHGSAVLGRVRRTVAGRGRVALRVRLSRAGRARLRRVRSARIAVRVRATSPNGAAVTLTGRRTVRR